MAKDYNTNVEQMKAISWQLKRIADQLEILNDNFKEKSPIKQSTIGSTKLKEFLNSLSD